MNWTLSGTNQAIWPIAIVALTAMLVAPLWCVYMPAMPDYPAHLAGFYLIAGGANNATLAQFYRIEWAFLPNLASELTVPVLGHLIGLNAATKIFLSIAVAFWAVSPSLIHRALYGRFGIAPLAGGLFAFNANFFWGFLNYYFAAGLALVVFAGWIASDKDRALWRLPVFAAAVFVVYICHVFAAALLLLLIACYEVQTWARVKSSQGLLRSGATVLALTLPTLCAFLFLRPLGSGGNIAFDFADTWRDRMEAMLQTSFDHPAWLWLGILALALIVFVWRRAIAVHPAMRLCLIVLAICTLLAPEWAMGGWGVQMRLPAILAALFFASVEIRLGAMLQKAVIVALLAIAGLGAAAAAGNWAYYNRQYDEFRVATQALPQGARVMTVLDGDAMGWASDQPYWHMAELEIPTRHIFTPLMFATPGQHVVQLQPSYQHIAAVTAWQGSPPDISELGDLAAGKSGDDKDTDLVFPYLKFFPCYFDNAIVIHSGGNRTPPPTMLTLLHRGSFFDLYAIRRSEKCARP